MTLSRTIVLSPVELPSAGAVEHVDLALVAGVAAAGQQLRSMVVDRQLLLLLGRDAVDDSCGGDGGLARLGFAERGLHTWLKYNKTLTYFI